MNKLQKRAWANLIIWPFFLLMYIIVCRLTSEDFDLKIAVYLVGALGIVVIVGITPVLCQKYLQKLFQIVRQGFEIAECGYKFYKKIEFDERDRTIKNKANLAGYIAVFWLYATACLIASFKESIPGSMLTILFVTGSGVYIFTRSLTLLILYGRGGKENE